MDRKQWYREIYLKSDWWQSRRASKLAQVNYRCEVCSKRKKLETHHLTYDRLWSELDADLQVLCRRCHQAAHGVRDTPPALPQRPQTRWDAPPDWVPIAEHDGVAVWRRYPLDAPLGDTSWMDAFDKEGPLCG